MAAKNDILRDKDGNQIFPATMAEQVSYDGKMNVKQAIKRGAVRNKVAPTVASMTDKEQIYVYTGTEDGYTFGNWYYWNGTAWTSGGAYNAVEVNTDGTLTEEGAPADAKATGLRIDSLKDDIGELSDVLGLNENEFYYFDSTGGSELDSSYNWLLKNPTLPKGIVFESIKLQTTKSDGTRVDIELSLFDETVNGYLTKYKTLNATGICNNGLITFTFNEYIEKNTHIAIKTSENVTSLKACTYDQIKDVSADQTLVNTGWMKYNIGITIYISCENNIDKLMALKNSEIHIGNGLDFEEIQDAIDHVNDNNIDNVTIIIHPKNTPYKRFSLMRKLDETYPWSGIASVKNISIIGIDKTKCIIQDNSGDYNTPPAEIACNGIIKNIVFIATHDEATGTQENPSYAVHVDNRPKDTNGMRLFFEDCDFISEQTAGVSLGIYKNQTVSFNRCRFFNNANLNYKPNENYHNNNANIGAFFAHTSGGYPNGNECISINDCEFISKESLYAIEIQDTNETQTCELEAINNTLWSYGSNSASHHTVNKAILQKPYNHGNNSDTLNS